VLDDAGLWWDMLELGDLDLGVAARGKNTQEVHLQTPIT
jgi:hypothetical protein